MINPIPSLGFMPHVQSFNTYYQICEFACAQGSFQYVANKVAIMEGQPQFKRAVMVLICYGIRS